MHFGLILPAIQAPGLLFNEHKICKRKVLVVKSKASENILPEGSQSNQDLTIAELRAGHEADGHSHPGAKLRKQPLQQTTPRKSTKHEIKFSVKTAQGPTMITVRPLPRVLILHTGGTLGMDPEASFEVDGSGCRNLKKGTGGSFKQRLRPGDMLSNLLNVVPELKVFADLDLKVVFNKDSSRIGPAEWIQVAKLLHEYRDVYDAFMVVHGTDTMAYTASALSLMLQGFKKPIVLTGSQLPLAMPRSDARQNLIDSLTCATSRFSPPHANLQEVAVCFGGQLMRGNRAQKTNSSSYKAFDSPTYPKLATLGIEVGWNPRFLLEVEGSYHPRFKLDPRVLRVPIVPGPDPRVSYGDLYGRGVRGIILETFGVGNMPDTKAHGWIPWLREQTKQGLQVHLSSQCTVATLHPELYRSGSMALKLGADSGPLMTPECAVVKMMLCLSYPDVPLGIPLAGEL